MNNNEILIHILILNLPPPVRLNGRQSTLWVCLRLVMISIFIQYVSEIHATWYSQTFMRLFTLNAIKSITECSPPSNFHFQIANFLATRRRLRWKILFSWIHRNEKIMFNQILCIVISVFYADSFMQKGVFWQLQLRRHKRRKQGGSEGKSQSTTSSHEEPKKVQ